MDNGQQKSETHCLMEEGLRQIKRSHNSIMGGLELGDTNVSLLRVSGTELVISLGQ